MKPILVLYIFRLLLHHLNSSLNEQRNYFLYVFKTNLSRLEVDHTANWLLFISKSIDYNPIMIDPDNAKWLYIHILFGLLQMNIILMQIWYSYIVTRDSLILAGISWKDYLSFYSNKKRGEWTKMKLVVTILYRLSVMITHTRMREKKIFFCRLWANYKLVHNQNNTTIDNMFWQAQKKSELVFKI